MDSNATKAIEQVPVVDLYTTMAIFGVSLIVGIVLIVIYFNSKNINKD